MTACESCPFRDGETESATAAQNLGCLPSAHEMIVRFDSEGVALSCHNDDSTPCRGLASVRSVKGAPVLGYSSWYHGK